ncbi:ferritin-like domain-containing protein [Leptospira sp. GIMC2001]|uniref:ferritin-like domain-containing protein n=1 Tax=Leptospira sp. GIMC2001 TaxID=1513297 RepID=UPI0023496C09|nr:ferritin family protein [Leptospira sp. GIMC2001]WCL47652.1 ferritin family protein [Leptospira sp. GIMC2001]
MKSLKKTTYLEAVAAAIEHEVRSFKFFMKMSDELKPGQTQELFQQLAADGDEHIKFIEEIYKQAEGKELPNLKTLSEIHKFHSSTIQMLMEKLERNMNQAVENDERKALELAVLHGDDAREFYGKLKDKFPDPKINLLFRRLQDFIDTNTNLIEAQIMALGQANQPELQFFWEDDSLMEAAAQGTDRKKSSNSNSAKSSSKQTKPTPSKPTKKDKAKASKPKVADKTKSSAKPKAKKKATAKKKKNSSAAGTANKVKAKKTSKKVKVNKPKQSKVSAKKKSAPKKKKKK